MITARLIGLGVLWILSGALGIALTALGGATIHTAPAASRPARPPARDGRIVRAVAFTTAARWGGNG